MTDKEELTQEQIKEFWEWCGFRFGREFPLTPQGSVYWEHEVAVDLNNLFKYAVPKLPLLGMDWQPITEEYFFETMKPDKPNLIVGKGKDPALALFWAIYQVIQEEKTNDR